MPIDIEKEVPQTGRPIANGGRVFPNDDLTNDPLSFVNEDDDVTVIGGFAGEYRLVKVTHIFQGTTSYTPTAGVRALFIECWGAGGGGGGAINAAVNSAAGGGGGGGGYSFVWSTALVSGAHTVSVGAGGTGASGADGNVGGDATFKDTDGTNICVAKGGAGGKVDTVAIIHVGGAGGAGGLASAGTGDLKQDGNAGIAGICLAAAQNVGGNGGAGANGGSGAPGNIDQTTTGSSAVNGYGGGGAGGTIISGGASQAGGAGANGLIRVWELA